jgi:hypothetical protein
MDRQVSKATNMNGWVGCSPMNLPLVQPQLSLVLV